MPEARDLPLFRWGDSLRRERAQRRRLRVRLALGAVGIAAMVATIVAPPRPLLVWNASASAPIGLYRVTSAVAVRRGDMVIAWVPRPWRRLAATRRYIPLNVPLVKRAVGVAGDIVCESDGQIYVNGLWAAWRQPLDGAGRPMPAWHGCRTLEEGALFLVMDARDSFDGRYFGPTEASDVVGRASLLWAR